MEKKDFLEALEGLKTDLEGKSKQEVKDAIKAFKLEFESKFEGLLKEGDLDEKFKTLASSEDLQKMQDHLDALDVKMQEKKSGKEDENEDFFAKAARENFDKIKAINSSSGLKLSYKDMTLGNALTGDQPRVYNNDVVRRRSQIVNVSDLATPITISGGTYTYTRSTLASGAVATQTEGSDKAQLEYDYTMVDANTDFIAGFAVYSKKMKNNLPFLESTLSMDLRDDYDRGENTVFQTILASEATASTEIITGQNKIEMLISELANLAAINTNANGIVVTPSDYYDILVTEKSTGAGYGLPGIVTFENGVLRVNGVPVFMAAVWLPANKYYVGNWERVRKVTTEGFSLAFSEEDSDNFRKNNITARVESQTTLTVERPSDLIYGDFTAT